MKSCFAGRLVVAALLLTGSKSLALDIIAHRGASHDAPENTVASTMLGWRQGADGVECDIHLTKDGKIIVIHDFDTKKVTGRDRKVVDQTLAELRELDAGAWKGPQWKGEQLATLRELLDTVPPGKRLVIEVKCGPEIMPELERDLKASGKEPEQLLIISFNYDVVVEARKRFPRIPALYLASNKKDKQTGELPTLDSLIAKAKAAKADGLNLEQKFPIDAAFVKRVHDAGLKFYVWTVNDAEAARGLVAAGVDGITTDRPQWLREQLNAAPGKGK
jgi:glycerophosphoryl diester phosphodiesterase